MFKTLNQGPHQRSSDAYILTQFIGGGGIYAGYLSKISISLRLSTTPGAEVCIGDGVA
jgi:hypothetical protein